jgi:2,4-dichlorophenol 6-monooxygenase
VLVVMIPMGPQRRGPASEEPVIHLNYPAGDPLPHAWIEDEDGHRRPVKDLLAPGRFLLIARGRRPRLVPGGQAARRAADRPPRRRPVRLALRLAAPPADRQRRRGPGPPGPVHRLAAPGWRQRPPAVLAAALGQILARPVGTLAASAI